MTFSYRGYLSEVKQQVADMAVNSSGIRDTARVLGISPTTVIEELKKSCQQVPGNEALLEQLPHPQNVKSSCSG
ncbi:IS1-like element transposase [Leptolyngbya sp. FACHB-16]|uniref:IS1-like element transposase n=1 Tax=unclassified Leptolyngbya TaxID=2650499 RepID=UPI001F54AE69|nr:IS1-like element transposase [Leptolyngbya sp. FACHB-16]